MRFNKSLLNVIILPFFSLPLTAVCQQTHIVINAKHVLNRIPGHLYGACIEDVNHEIYGGLYNQRIFGESFEEPTAGPVINGWKAFGGNWQPTADAVSVKAGEGYKLVRQQTPGANYTAEVMLKFGSRNDNAGVLVNLNNTGNGADSFDGYEISLDPNKQVLVFGKHQNNWTPIREVKVSVDFKDWIKLKVDVAGNVFKVYLNNSAQPVATLTDERNTLPPGTIALRTYNADVEFKNLSIKTMGITTLEKFVAKPLPSVSGAWDAINTTGTGGFLLDDKDAYNGRQSQVVIHNGDKGVIGVANSGLNRWGMAVRKGNSYTGSIYLKGTGLTGGVTLALQSADGKKVYATQLVKKVSANWAVYPIMLKATQTDARARFVLTISSKGKLWADQATLMCKQEQFKNLPLRGDIGKAMQREGLSFLRYGGTMVNAEGYRWKKMIGPRAKRPPYTGYWYSYSTNGFGIEDFLQFCEAAGFEAAFAINIEETPQDMADMVEYLKGSTATKWGRQRAANGHPAPYKVKYIEIGNEEVIFHGDVTAEYDHYTERFNLLQSVMHAKDTTIKFICSAWWRPASPNMARVFKAINGKADYWDLHTDADDANSGRKVDSSLTQMRALFRSWDANTRLKCTIFEENGNHHDLARALGHAGTLNAVRRHGDFVLTSCAANALQALGQNDNGWDQGQVFFTPSQVWGMPPFYAQQMASAAHLPLNIEANATGVIDVSATRSEDGKTIAIHIVNPAANACQGSISLKGMDKDLKEAVVTQLAGKLTDINTPGQPAHISPKTTKINVNRDGFNYTIPASSYTIIRLYQK
jgi:alpha-L-arabinofuranosidase